MKTFEQLKEELSCIEKEVQLETLGGQNPGGTTTPYPEGGTNCEMCFAESYSGSEHIGTDQGWVCEDCITDPGSPAFS